MKRPCWAAITQQSVRVLLGLILHSVASVLCVLGQIRARVKLNPSEYEGLVQTMDATIRMRKPGGHLDKNKLLFDVPVTSLACAHRLA